MKSNDTEEMKLTELAEKAGVSARTIRLYITKGLLPGPRRAGREAAYGPEHLKVLAEIKQMQGAGLTLTQIRQGLAGVPLDQELPAPEAWCRYTLSAEVMVLVRADLTPWRLRQIHQALSIFQGYLQPEKSPMNDHGR